MPESPTIGDAIAAKKIHIYSNGDRFFTGRRFVINPRQTRNYESFLNQVTLSLKPAFGAVRVLRTPENGHPVNDLQDLETGRSYVACAQKFVKLGYQDITEGQKVAQPLSPLQRKKLIASGRIRKIERNPIAIFVYVNGEPLEPAKRLLLKPWVQKTWETVLLAINEKVSLRSGAVRHVIEMSSKTEVTEGAQLKNNDYYVAVGSEKFKDVEYGSQTAVLSTKHLQKRRYPSLAPIKKGSGSESSADAFSDRRQSLVEDSPMTVEKEETVARPKKKAAALEPAKEEGIPVKPIKHIKRADTEKPANDMVMEEPRRQVVEDHADKRAEEPQAIHAEQQNQNKSEQGTSGKRVAGNSKLSKADKPSDDAKSKSSKDDKPKEVPSAQPAAPKKVQDDKPPAPLASKKAPVEPASQPSVPKKVQADSAPQTSVAKKMTDSKAKHGEKKASTKKPEPVSKQEKEIDFDQDDGGIFKSKSKKQIAKEIPEADNVETDVPIDKRPAQEIEEVEEDHRNDNDEEDFDELLNGAATKIQAAYKGYRVRLEIG